MEVLYTNVDGLANKLHEPKVLVNSSYEKHDVIKVLYTNVRSLTSGTKREELSILMKDKDIDILGLTETWGRSDISDSEFDFPGYKLFRKDRSALNDKKGGGVALYVRSNFFSSECENLNSKKCESMWCKVYVNSVDYIIVGVCYRSPDVEDKEREQLFDCIKSATDLKYPVLIMGDFNFPGVSWAQLKADDAGGQKFVNVVMDCFLEQHVLTPTRKDNILDLVLTNEIQVRDEVKVTAPVGNSDHNVLSWEIECSIHKLNYNRTKLCFNRADYDSMRQFVRNKLQYVESELMSASTLWHNFNDIMQDSIKRFVPIITCGNVKQKPLWMTGKVSRNVKKKHKLWKKWKEHNEDDDLLRYKKQANKASKLVRRAKKEFENKIAQNIKKDSKSFYTYVRSKSRVKPSVGPLTDNTGSLVSSEKEMGNVLNKFFASVFTNENIQHLPEVRELFRGHVNEKICSYSITADMVKSKLSRLKMNKAPGVDSVGTRMLLELSEEISDTVAVLFNKSLTSGDIPLDWKLANVSAVFKKGKKSSPSNYRPISLTVNLCKVFESIMRDKLIEHLEKYELIKESQHGFVRNKSCLTNLLTFIEEITEYLDSGYPVDVIYLDFQKAFDKVPHQRLVLKLSAHGIGGEVLRWIENWLRGRKQRVVLGGEVSEWCDILSGVPQGSVLGPLLFVLYINDIDDSVSSRILKFADDTKIFKKVSSFDSTDELRADLTNLVSWSNDWQMLFNIDKCKVLHLGYNNCHADYFMDTVQLQKVSEERDLGIIVSDDLKWEKQCIAAVKQGNKVLGMIKRNFVDRSQETIMALYKNLVRPHLEYCSPIWNPYLAKDIKLIEGVQRRATKLVQGIEHWKYDERLKFLGLTRLEKRRTRSDLIETYKIMNGKYDISRDLCFKLDDGGRRGHDQKLFKRRFRLDVRKFTFSNRVVDNWNSLSACCVNSSSINVFKKHVSVELESEAV